MKYTEMKKLYILILTILFFLAVPVQTFSQSAGSAGMFENNKSENNTNQGNSSDDDSSSGFFRVGSTENPDDAGRATKEGEEPSDVGNGIIIASTFFAAFYILMKIRKNKRTLVINDEFL
jgi:hypothetical protein